MNWKKNLLSFLLGLSGVFMKAQNPVSLLQIRTVEYLYPFHHGRQPEKMCGISTQSGLNRYDGVKMNVYRHKKGEAGTWGMTW